MTQAERIKEEAQRASITSPWQFLAIVGRVSGHRAMFISIGDEAFRVDCPDGSWVRVDVKGPQEAAYSTGRGHDAGQ